MIDIEDVLDAIMVFLGHFESISLKIDFFISIFSVTASMTKSELITELKLSEYKIFLQVFS